MEIERYFEEYKKHSPEEFYNWISSGKTMEVRFLSDKDGRKFGNWDLIKHLAEKIGAEHRFSSLYINSFKELKDILLFRINGIALTRLYNIFIGVNPRRKVFTKAKSGLLKKTYYGGIAGTSHIQNILCDIEHRGLRDKSATEDMLEECIQGALYLVKLHQLEDYYINISGNGVHLWFRLQEPIPIPIPKFTEFADKIKYNLKQEDIYLLIKTYNRFIENMDKDLQGYNPNLKVDDGAKDIARIARPTGSWNVKTGKIQRSVGTVVKSINNNKYNNKNFMAAKPIMNKEYKTIKKTANNTNRNRYNHLTISESPLVKLLLSGMLPSILSRNHYLEQSFAKLLRDNDISIFDIQDLIAKIDATQGKTIQVDPDYLEDNESFNPETINAYCFGSRIDLVYPIMDDIPDITDGYITEKHYETLNSVTDISIDKLAFEIKDEINSMFELKTLIRNLVDNKERSSIFFSLKKKLREEWDYFHRNKIILQIMNKTRPRSDDENYS